MKSEKKKEKEKEKGERESMQVTQKLNTTGTPMYGGNEMK